MSGFLKNDKAKKKETRLTEALIPNEGNDELDAQELGQRSSAF